METSQKSMQNNCQTSTSYVADFLAKLSALLETEWALKIQGARFFMNLRGLLNASNLKFYSLKTSKGYSLMRKGEQLPLSSKLWMNWGMMQNGRCLTASILEYHKIGRESSLSDILEANPDSKYFLSQKQQESILARAKEKNKDGAFTLRASEPNGVIVHSLQTRNKDRPSLKKNPKAGGSGHISKEEEAYCLDTGST